MDTIILNIETSTRSCSVCLSKNAAPWIIKESYVAAGHASNLTMYIQEVMETANMSLDSVHAIAYSQGPGSYTGLRIGVSTAKGLAYALGKPLIAIDTLKALAAGAAQRYPAQDAAYVAMIDARRMDAYVAVYGPALEAYKAAYFCTLEGNAFDTYLKQEGIHKIIACGDALPKFMEHFGHQQPEQYQLILPSAQFMSALSFHKFKSEDFVDVAYSEPFYLKAPNITKPKPKF